VLAAIIDAVVSEHRRSELRRLYLVTRLTWIAVAASSVLSAGVPAGVDASFLLGWSPSRHAAP
jgi:hypothetical protein